ncbi:MAG: universal stress protein [Bacteroidota bacterium]
MKNILMPTDFSKTADNAFRYLQQFTEEIAGELTVLNVYHPSVDTDAALDTLTLEVLADIRKKQLIKFVNGHAPGGMPEVMVEEPSTQLVLPGFAAEVIIDQSSDGTYDLVAMGTSGRSGLLSKMFGSVSIEVAQKAACPVWLIPPKASY